MVTAYMDRAEGTAVGYDMSATVGTAMGRAEGSAVGFPMLGIGAPPTIGAVPDALRLEIVTAAGAQLVPDLPRRNLTFTVEHNGSGEINFETDLDNFPDGLDDPLLDPNNLVRVHFGDLPGWPYGVAEGFIASSPPNWDDTTKRWVVKVSCLGSADVLEFGLLWPPAGATGNTREFSYTAGMTAPGYVASEWHTPVGRNVKTSFRWAHRWPRGWSESKAQWIWVTSPEKYGPLRTCQFLGDPFTLTEPADVHFDAAGDETLKLYLNGARIKTKRRGAWKRKASFTRRLPAGTHTVSAEVKNVSGGDNKSGFICAISQLNRNGDRVKWLLRSATSTFKVKVGASFFGQVPLPPDGWYPPAVLLQAVNEAAARGTAFHPQIVPTYSYTADSGGSTWTDKGPSEYDIQTSNGALAEKVRSLGSDVAMLPGLRLSAWKHRGFDLRERVFLARPGAVGWPSRTGSRVRTVALTHHESGYTETAGDAGLAAEYGRRELPVSGGGTDGDLQADALATAAMLTAAGEEDTIEATVNTAQMVGENPQPMPFRDYGVADIVSMATIGGFTPAKVMTFRFAERDDKSVDVTIAGYPA